MRRFSTQSASSWKSIVGVDADNCGHGDVDSGVPRVHQRAFAASCLRRRMLHAELQRRW